jgi:hypothetical protein
MGVSFCEGDVGCPRSPRYGGSGGVVGAVHLYGVPPCDGQVLGGIAYAWCLLLLRRGAALRGVPLAFRCRRYGYMYDTGVMLGSSPIVLSLLFVGDVLVPYAPADGYLAGEEGNLLYTLSCSFRLRLN